MPTLPATMPRHGWLEALRGVAALQVLLLHLLGAFWLPLVTGEGGGPAAWLARSPLALLWDGESAVYLFFTMSGVVLAGAFARQVEASGAAFAARLLRLGLPGAAACLLAFLAFHAFPGAHRAAAERLGASWLGGNWTGDGSLASLFWEAGPGLLLLGFDPALAPLPSIASAYNGPLWTLAIELRGSLLVLLLLLARRRWPRAWAWGAALALAWLWRSAYGGFLAGALVALAAPHLPAAAALRRAAPALGLGGALLSWLALRELPDGLALPGGGPGWPAALPAADLLRSLGAALGLGAVAALPGLRRWLERPWLAVLGRLSFPLYLVHWPMILGPGAAAFVALEPRLGGAAARLAGMAAAALLSLLLALAFRPVDEAAIRWSRRLRAALAARGSVMPAAALARRP
ncbi:acyltransferase family protein [Paracraurococcus lichenis]|uniref:Acyltransferase family protein n=1 Tax=Paracraurococcus lichenis TaxID=3064888 RepID=A0ABT9E4M4_9PROT|nr:acyltransferase family protein [Paracraurococcus sp. LOR1-02]MDO9711089.1 acyltransferase family protein [Paracraurococcus sp. LOR1-02]